MDGAVGGGLDREHRHVGFPLLQSLEKQKKQEIPDSWLLTLAGFMEEELVWLAGWGQAYS